MLAMGTVLRRERAVQDALRLRHALRRGRPADAQELGQRDRLRRGRRADGRRRHALDVLLGPARRQHPVRLARRRRGPAGPPRPVERVRVLRDLCPPRRLADPRPVAGTTARPPRRSPNGARSTAGSCRAPPARPRGSATGWRTTTRARRRSPIEAFIDDLSTWYLRRSRRRFSRAEAGPDRDAAFATLHAALVGARPDRAPRSCRSSPSRCTATSSPTATGRPRTASTSPSWPADELAPAPRRAPRGRDGDGPAGGRARPDPAQRRPGSGSASRSPGSGSPCPAATCRSATPSSRSSPTR